MSDLKNNLEEVLASELLGEVFVGGMDRVSVVLLSRGIKKVEQLEQELQKTREQLAKCEILVDEIILDIERCDRYFQSSSTRNQFQRKQLNRKKYYLKDKQGE